MPRTSLFMLPYIPYDDMSYILSPVPHLHVFVGSFHTAHTSVHQASVMKRGSMLMYFPRSLASRLVSGPLFRSLVVHDGRHVHQAARPCCVFFVCLLCCSGRPPPPSPTRALEPSRKVRSTAQSPQSTRHHGFIQLARYVYQLILPSFRLGNYKCANAALVLRFFGP